MSARSAMQWPRAVGFGLLLMVLAVAAGRLVLGAELSLRAGLLRSWSLISTGAFATMLPHVLLPDDRLPLNQLLNRSPGALLRDQAGRWGRWVAVFGMPAVVLAFYAPGAWGQALAAKSAMGAQNVLTIVGVGGYSLLRYMTVGPRLQAWHEGHAGQWYHAMREEQGAAFAVPPGLVPTMFTTARIMLVGLAALLIAAALRQAGCVGAALVPGGLLVGVVGFQLWRAQRGYDRPYYSTNAAYNELLGGSTEQAAAREPVTMAALYWVPARWRPATWASLRQLDRMLPLGRFVLLGHVLLWVLAARGMAGPLIEGYLLLFVLAQNSACVLLTRDRAAPPAFQLTMQSVVDWGMTRLFVNLRWTAPLILSLSLLALFDRSFGGADVMFWTGLDLAAAAIAAGLTTMATEAAARRRYT